MAVNRDVIARAETCMSIANALTSASSASGDTTRLTSPISHARSALIGVPVSSSSIA